jgi:hypothetical protein
VRVVAIALIVACSSPTSPVNEPKPLPVNEPKPSPINEPRLHGPGEPLAEDGQACSRNEHCTSGVCEGEGCYVQGVCVPAVRQCTEDLRTYCACDGTTFRASSSCPGRMHAGKGACPSEMNRPVGAACTSAAECASKVCEGEGCDKPGRCADRMRTCTADDVMYCDCDGRTRRSTSSCPSLRFAKRGACER